MSMQGLDGDATEPIVDSLPDPGEESADPEEEFQVAAALLDTTGSQVSLAGSSLEAVAAAFVHRRL